MESYGEYHCNFPNEVTGGPGSLDNDSQGEAAGQQERRGPLGSKCYSLHQGCLWVLGDLLGWWKVSGPSWRPVGKKNQLTIQESQETTGSILALEGASNALVGLPGDPMAETPGGLQFIEFQRAWHSTEANWAQYSTSAALRY